MASEHIRQLKQFKPKEHLPLCLSVVGLLVIIIVCMILVKVSQSKLTKAERTYTVIREKVENFTYETKENLISKMPIHNGGAVDLLQEISDLEDGVSEPFTLSCVPGDSVTSPEYHNRRVKSDTEFIKNWMRPVFDYGSLDDYFNNMQTMKDRFNDAKLLRSEMHDCAVRFFIDIMPPAPQLQARMVTMTDKEKRRYNASFTMDEPIVVNADANNDPYTYSYFVKLCMYSQNPEHKAPGKPNGERESNYCALYTIERDADGNPILCSFRLVGISDEFIFDE